ncbi:hypothetical protein COEREDRAFT_6360 [Coemansia reversa NRRL 1564]|uniref:Uncharacterized protein n=1 Tax=Coemansia reversa (strain ATCC 12441 / NRRL 1564) TaxID=763665 RepID=A0A2G5BI08_COERN|nr:hypothetical protein COEREDRAFT_6360 [Coemansia reversa NRRL 1564]|eukprot:PIA18654.1 hypothetical protein COEREDRAFT_6360 [Coemansia reversa NRRL 1564]
MENIEDVQHGPVINSSAIADLSSRVAHPKSSPLADLFRRREPDKTTTHEKYARRVASSDDSASNRSHVKDYECIYDVVRACLETDYGERGSEEQRIRFAEIMRKLINSPEGLDIAAVAFLATISNNTLVPETRTKIAALIRHKMCDSGFHEDAPRLDDMYTKFVSDTYRYRSIVQDDPVSILDVNRFAYKWLHRADTECAVSAFHWTIRGLSTIPTDSMSDPFDIHGIKCALRFRRSYLLTNGETWTGMWLHNISSGRKVLSAKFALVLSNVAYPTLYHVEVIKPSSGIRPSQGVGVKLFVLLSRLTQCIDGSTHPLLEHNSIRASVVIT